MILVDSNSPMYLIGSPHPHKTDAQRLLEKLIADRERLVTDAKVLQEILHRYVAIDRRQLSCSGRCTSLGYGTKWNLSDREFRLGAGRVPGYCPLVVDRSEADIERNAASPPLPLDTGELIAPVKRFKSVKG